MTRKTLSKSLRFEVFQRDKFTCRYCGKKAPDILLEVDHIIPVIEGGDNELKNLVAACFDCNRGKGKKLLSKIIEDENVGETLEYLKEKQLQLKEYYKFINKQKKSDPRGELINKIYSTITDGKYTMTESGIKSALILAKKYGDDILIEALKINERGKPGQLDFAYVGGICRNTYLKAKFPEGYDFYYKYLHELDRKRPYIGIASKKEYLMENYDCLYDDIIGHGFDYKNQDSIYKRCIKVKADWECTRKELIGYICENIFIGIGYYEAHGLEQPYYKNL